MGLFNTMDLIKLKTQKRTKQMRQCGKGFEMNYELLITSVYGLKNNQSKKSKIHFENQRLKAIELLGDKYLLAKPIKKLNKEIK